jgi:hypothetical protein
MRNLTVFTPHECDLNEEEEKDRARMREEKCTQDFVRET